ncbi:MAG: FAD:protein FMN transferase [Flavobacteriales bacterium]|nr:FAD:protein FMN transferase [Flavobacteriales bacterium]
MKRSLLAFTVLVLFSCTEDSTSEIEEVYTIMGEAQGTTYTIKYLNPDSLTIEKAAVDSLLDAIDQSLSTWVEGSVISLFNSSDTMEISDPHFITIFERGRELHALTDGAFNPMVSPLVRAWGFGPEGGQLKDGVNIDSLSALSNFDLEVEPAGMREDGSGLDTEVPTLIFRKKPGMEIDVNGYAQGYAVDVIVDFLERIGVTDMMVEVGGEVAARGVSGTGDPWRIGIDKPVSLDEMRKLQAAIPLIDAALATSGTYRKFYEKDGKKYSHTIDPKTGYPVEHNLLSVTVMASNATNADALATAFLVKGVEGTNAFLAAHPDMNLEVYLISDEGDGRLSTFMSKGWEEIIEEF